MADPNRKINLNLPSDDDDSDEPDLDPSEIALVKEFEEEFKDRFTESDQIFNDFCKQKSKPPPIVFPFDGFHHHRGGHRGGNRGGRFQHFSHRHNFDNRRNNDNRNYEGHGQRHNNYNNHRNRDHQPPYKKRREETSGSGAP